MRTPLASLAFFLSGLAALIYQVVWQRMLVLPIGADVYSTTVIVGAFMAASAPAVWRAAMWPIV